MTRAAVWEEVRGRWRTWAVFLLTVVAGVLIAVAVWGRPGAGYDYHFYHDLFLKSAWVAGLLTGASLLVGVRVVGPTDDTDAWVAARWHDWRTKVVVGVVAIVLQIAVLAALAAPLGLTFQAVNVLPFQGLLAGPVRLGLVGSMGLAWGLLGSSVCRTTVGASAAAAACWVVMEVGITETNFADLGHDFSSAFETLVILTGLPLLASSWVYTDPGLARSHVTPVRSSARVVVWKEFRELWPVWAAFFALALLATHGVVAVLPPRGAMEAATFAPHVAALVAWAVGLLTGASLLAGERDTATLDFLDTLPATRWHVWRVKAAAGAWVVPAGAAILTGLVLSMGPAALGRWNGWEYFAAFLAVGGIGFAWGLFGSSVCRTALGAFLLGGAVCGAALSQVPSQLAWATVARVVRGYWPSYGGHAHRSPHNDFVLVVVLMLGLPLLASAVLFTRRGRGRWLASTRRRLQQVVESAPAGLADGGRRP